MPSFGVIAEGQTDRVVIDNVLHGFFADQDDDPIVNPVQPPASHGEHAGWNLVFACLERGDVVNALQWNDFVIIHIDTDVQDHAGFDVPRREGGRELITEERIANVIERLKRAIGAAACEQFGHRILFAIAVESIECWLLPLLYDDKKAEKTTGCEDAANKVLRKANKDGLSGGGNKFPRSYDAVSRGFLKRKRLIEARVKNVSLDKFLQQLENLPLGSSDPTTPDKPADTLNGELGSKHG